MKRAIRPVVCSGFLQLDIAGNQLNNIQPRFDVVDRRRSHDNLFNTKISFWIETPFLQNLVKSTIVSQ